MLPAVKKPGEVIGQTIALTEAVSESVFFLGIPTNKPVYVPMGDHPCSVMAALAQQQSPNDTNLTRTLNGDRVGSAVILTQVVCIS